MNIYVHTTAVFFHLLFASNIYSSTVIFHLWSAGSKFASLQNRINLQSKLGRWFPTISLSSFSLGMHIQSTQLQKVLKKTSGQLLGAKRFTGKKGRWAKFITFHPKQDTVGWVLSCFLHQDIFLNRNHCITSRKDILLITHYNLYVDVNMCISTEKEIRGDGVII